MSVMIGRVDAHLAWVRSNSDLIGVIDGMVSVLGSVMILDWRSLSLPVFLALPSSLVIGFGVCWPLGS